MEPSIRIIPAEGRTAVDVDPTTLTRASGKRVLWHCATCLNEWRSVVAVRTNGSGCPECATHGYQESRPGHVYLLSRNRDGTEQRKVGITNVPKVRIGQLRRTGWRLIEISVPMDGALTRDVERRFLAALDGAGINRRAKPADITYDPGHTETWAYEQFPVDHISEVLAIAGVEAGTGGTTQPQGTGR